MPAPVEIVDRAKFQGFLKQALDRSNQLASEVPAWDLPLIAKAQLEFMQSCLENGNSPSDEDKERVNIGVIAMRNLEESEPEYADWLKELDYAFRRYEALP